ncbi:MAG: chromate resistance protein ChrB domain-containing protein [Candidatus Cybelea sp.]
MVWQLLVTSLSGNHGALRLRFWRALKALGAGVLRDGVYIAPDIEVVSRTFAEQAGEIVASGGSAFVLTVPNLPRDVEVSVTAMFDRSAQYHEFGDSIDTFLRELRSMTEGEARRAVRQLTREFSLIEAIDFFPRDARDSAVAALREADGTLTRTFSPDEPTAVHASVPRRDRAEFQGKTWATRAHLWVDRVASAWLIRRFIDPGAFFIWLQSAADCPASAIGFDFDGAPFTHVEDYVTFEVLLRSFGLEENPGLVRLGLLVHQLDVGSGNVPEAAGFEAILTGTRERCRDDDAFLAEMSRTLDDLYRAFCRPAVKP